MYQQQNKDEGNVDLLLNGAEDLVTKVMEKAEVLHAFFILLFTGKIDLQES